MEQGHGERLSREGSKWKIEEGNKREMERSGGKNRLKDRVGQSYRRREKEWTKGGRR